MIFQGKNKGKQNRKDDMSGFSININGREELNDKLETTGDLTYDYSINLSAEESTRLSVLSPREDHEGKQCELRSPLRSPRQNQITIGEYVIVELEASKLKLIGELKNLQGKYQNMQNDKIGLVTDICNFKNEISSLRAQEVIAEDQIHSLTFTNIHMVDELNFHRQLTSDYQKQYLNLKMTIKNILTLARQNSEQNKLHNEEIMGKIVLIQNKANKLRSQLSSIKNQFNCLSNTEKGLEKVKGQLSHYLQSLQSEQFMLKMEIRNLQESSVRQKTSNIEKTLETQIYLKEKQVNDKIVKQLQEENKKLSHQLRSLRQKQILWASTMPQNSPDYHTNTQYLHKILTQHHYEIQNLKEELIKKDEELQMLRQENMVKKSLYNQVTEQLEQKRLVQNLQENKILMETQQELKRIRKDKQILNKKIEQYAQAQKNLREEIVQKDKIIMIYVEQQNKNKQK